MIAERWFAAFIGGLIALILAWPYLRALVTRERRRPGHNPSPVDHGGRSRASGNHRRSVSLAASVPRVGHSAVTGSALRAGGSGPCPREETGERRPQPESVPVRAGARHLHVAPAGTSGPRSVFKPFGGIHHSAKVRPHEPELDERIDDWLARIDEIERRFNETCDRLQALLDDQRRREIS